eukprot:COSAG06_NODE_102_length_23983_cov_152.911363_13_plen_71_part_00
MLLLLMLRRTHPPSHYRTMTMMMTALSYTDYTYCAVLGHMCSSGAWMENAFFILYKRAHSTHGSTGPLIQ